MGVIAIYIVVTLVLVVTLVISPCEGKLCPFGQCSGQEVHSGGSELIESLTSPRTYKLRKLEIHFDDLGKRLFIKDGMLICVINYMDIQSLNMRTSSYIGKLIPSMITFYIPDSDLQNYTLQFSNQVTLFQVLTSESKRALCWEIYEEINKLIKMECEKPVESSRLYIN